MRHARVQLPGVAAAAFPLWIAGGLTNVCDMMDCPGDRDTLIACLGDKRRWNAEVAAGRLTAPRIVETASYYFESPDLTPAAALQRVCAHRARGYDTIGVYYRRSPGAYRAIAAEARTQRLRHLPRAVALEAAIDAGQVSFEHARILLQHSFPRRCLASRHAGRGIADRADRGDRRRL